MNPNPEHVGQTTVIVSPVSESSMIRPFPPHFVHGSIFIQHSCDILDSAYATGLCCMPKCAASFVRRPTAREHLRMWMSVRAQYRRTMVKAVRE